MRSALATGVVVLLTLAVGTATAAEKSKSAMGKVTAVAADSVTIAQGTAPMTFVVDGTTKIIGKGLTTKTNEKAAKGEKLDLKEAVGTDDRVTITYTEVDGKMHATVIKITQKALTAK